MIEKLRPTAVAGAFYESDPDRLSRVVDEYLSVPAPAGPAPKALIVPHAGYRYSGPIAATGYAALAARAGAVKRVLLLGPAHRVAVRGIALSGADGFATPLGVVPIDSEARETALAMPGVAVDDDAHRDEHSLEVHLPFLQRTLGELAVLPMLVGSAPAGMVADVLEALWGGSETAIVVSSDLSHYEPYDLAAEHDRSTANAIIDGRIDRIGPMDACGCYPIRGLLEVARRRRLHVRLLDLRSSGDTAGDRDRVVGYGSFAVAAS